MAARAVAVIGPGALGLLYASRLSKVVPTAVIARNAARAAELRRGVRVGGRLYTPDAFGPDELPQADWVIVLVKTHQTAAAIRVAARMKPKGVLSLQNGLIEQIPQGVTTAGAYRDGRKVVPVALGKTLLPRGFEPLAGYLRRAGFPVRVTRKIGAARLHKLLANVCINPVTALFRIRNGEIRKRPYRVLAEALAREAAPVLSREGLEITAAEAVSRVMDVARITAQNRSSMLQDLLAGRKTEREHLTGALLRLARRHRVAVPTHRALYEVIRVMESR
jgi:2-dehydropantoate 2-reductase